MRLISPERVLQRLKLQSTAEYDGVVTNWIEVVSEQVENFLGRKLTYGVYEEYFDGGTNCLSLAAYPVFAIQALSECGSIPRTWDSGAELSEDDYDIDADRGLVYHLGRDFIRGIRAVRVDYTGGYECDSRNVVQVPAPIAQAVEDQVSFYVRRRDQMDVVSVSYGDGSQSRQERWDLLPGVKAMLRAYRRLVVG